MSSKQVEFFHLHQIDSSRTGISSMITAHILRLIFFHPACLRMVLSALRFLLAVLKLLDMRSAPVDSKPETCAALPVIASKHLLVFFQQRADTCFHISPDIPQMLLNHVSRYLESYAEGEMLAVLDVSSQGTTRSFLLFTSEGVGYHNDFRSRATGAGFLYWRELLKKRFTRASWAEVKMDQEVWLDRSGCLWSSRQLAQLMSELQQFLITQRESEDWQNL